MSKVGVKDLKLARARRALEKSKGNVTQAARALGIERTTLQRQLRRAGIPPADTPSEAGPEHKVYAEPAKTRVFGLLAAQDDTPMYSDEFRNLKGYIDSRGGEIKIGGFTYQKGLFEDHSVAAGVYPKELLPYLCPEVVQLAPKLVWYGRANILPTATDPLTGWDTNTRDNWAIFPHAKIALKSVPMMPGKMGKQIMTTGVITKPNYVQRNAGQKSEFHHSPGATIVEVKPNGTFFCRQIAFNKDGSFQDLDVLVRDGKMEKGPPIEGLTYGDIHLECIDPVVAKVLWGYDVETRRCSGSSMLDELRPRHQFFHDSFDFKARSHHTRNDPHERLSRIKEGNDSVSGMLKYTARFLSQTHREWSKSVHVASNHNMHLEYWLKDQAGHFDAVNAATWHRLNAAWFDAIDAKEEGFSAHAHGLRTAGEDLSDIVFLRQGDSYTICQGTQPIECGLHADVGPRGGKGSAPALAKIVERVNGAHSHEPRILEAFYSAGTSSIIPMAYAAKGPNAWAHSEIVTYHSGKRTIVTLQNGAYRA